jgi:hypothetical protein
MMWFYNNQEFTSADIKDNLGFVYLITNMRTMKMYVGKKKFFTTKTTQKNKKKVRTKIESDWQKYYGSSKALQEDVKEIGPYKFHREILHLCKSKGWLNFLELKEQMLRDVLLSDGYYNDYVGSRIHRKHLTKK